MAFNRSNCAFALCFLLIGILVGWMFDNGLARVLHAQFAEQARPADSRADAYAQLDSDARHLDFQANVVRRVVQLSSPFVVHIEAKKLQNPSSQRSRLVEEAGSGIVILHQGRFHILTNRHVVKDAANDKILIRLDDGREFHPASIVSDADTDIAVLGVEESDLTPARLGNSDAVEIGDFVLAVGSPFGLSRSVTYGIISAKGRRDLELGGDVVRYQDFLQTDAAINPGNSGGPLLNMRGEVIGLNTAIASSSGGNEGIGFSIPINMALVVARQLVENGMVRRAFLGVNLDGKFTAAIAVQLGLPRRMGARVTSVTPDSPAAQADIRVGDVVLDFNGVPVQDDVHLVNLVSLTPVGAEIPVTIYRDGRRLPLRLKVSDRRRFEQRSQLLDADEPAIDEPYSLGDLKRPLDYIYELGVHGVKIDAQVAEHLQLPAGVQGWFVTSVDADGPLAGRVRSGEIIDRVASQPVADADDLRRALDRDTEEDLPIHILPLAGSDARPRTLIVRSASATGP